MQNKRTIESILDLETGREVFATDLLSKSIVEVFQLRYACETGISKHSPRFVCYYCKQAIKLKGKPDSKKILHFAHLKDSAECPIKTNNQYSKEEILRIKYNGVKESELHINLKTFIADALKTNQENSKGIEFVDIEKINRHQAIPKIWKRPDVTSIFLGQNVVFELQLSTTFLSVINSRQEFYKENKTYILWVFNRFETDEDKRRFTQSDVFYNNNRNGFELNEESQQQSKKEQDLILKCLYEKPVIENGNITYNWESAFVLLTDLTFDPTTYKVYYYDVEGNTKQLRSELTLKKSILIKLIENEEYSDYNIYDLFAEGYNYSDAEKKYILHLYEKYVKDEALISRSSIGFRVVIATICLKLDNKVLIQQLKKDYSHKRAIIDILCLKLNKIIGYNVPNQIQVSHYFISHCPEHLDLYLHAIKRFQPNYLLKYDKAGKFSTKAQEILKSDKKQFFDQKIMFKMFPELKADFVEDPN